MRIQPECFVCLLRLGLRAARAATPDPGAQREVLSRVAAALAEIPEKTIPPEMGRRVQQIVLEVTGNDDPFREAKRLSNRIGLELYPELARRVNEAEDPLLEAVKLAIAGNAIDLAVGSDSDPGTVVSRGLADGPVLLDYEPFRRRAGRAARVLYLADNAGEVVFDRLLVEQLRDAGARVTFAVRSAPAINDATRKDAVEAGLDRVAEVVTTGSSLPSVILREASASFRGRFREVDLVISKGQGNFEGLSEEPGPIAFLLKAKCAPVAAELGVERGTAVLRYREPGA